MLSLSQKEIQLSMADKLAELLKMNDEMLSRALTIAPGSDRDRVVGWTLAWREAVSYCLGEYTNVDRSKAASIWMR